MKKWLVATAACVFTALSAHAQLEKGRFLAGGQLGLTSTKASRPVPGGVSDYKSTNTNIFIRGGVFAQQNLLVAVQLGRWKGQQLVDGDDDYDIVENETSGGLMLRRYFPVGNGFYLHIEGNLQYTHSTGRRVFSGSGQYYSLEADGIALQAGTGISYAFMRRLQLDVSLGNLLGIAYSSSTARDAAELRNRRTAFGAGFGKTGPIPLNVGFNILLGK